MSNKYQKSFILKNENISISIDDSKAIITELKSSDDPLDTNFVMNSLSVPKLDVDDYRWLGTLTFCYRLGDGEIVESSTALGNIESIHSIDTTIIVDIDMKDFCITMRYQLHDDALEWSFDIHNFTTEVLEFTGIGIPLPMDQYFRNDRTFKYDQNVLRHTFISFDSSYVYWARTSGVAPILLMTPCKGTRLEHLSKDIGTSSPFGQYFSEFEVWEGLVSAYICSDSEQEKRPGTGVLPPSIIRLASGETLSQGFSFQFVDSFSDIQDKNYQNGLISILSLPGMAVQEQQIVTLLLRCKETVHRLIPEYSDECSIIKKKLTHLGDAEKGYYSYEIIFDRLGANNITVEYGDDQKMVLYYFVMEPLAALIQKHAAFISEMRYETDPDEPCYHAFLTWDMVNKQRINTKCNKYGDNWWTGGSDEIGLNGILFLSEKNVYLPDNEQIRKVDESLNDFIVGKLTEQPGWRVHRMVPWFEMFDPWTDQDADDVWRAFNYIHVINVCINLYKIRKLYNSPFLKPPTYYIELAFNYTKGMFTYWMFPDGVGATEYGNMGEAFLPLQLEDFLIEEGFIEEADWVRKRFVDKAVYFSQADYPFGSEMAYDSTAYEAVYGYGKRYDDQRIMETSVKASYSNRGHQHHWHLYNTDLRGLGESLWNISYMTQLGAFPIYDYSMIEGNNDLDLIISAVASYTAGWTLINSCFYSDDPENIGASCWIVNTEDPENRSSTNGSIPVRKQAWPLSGESGLGYFGALKIACSVLIEHPVLGLVGLGCQLIESDSCGGIDNDSVLTIYSEDGVSMRFFDMIQNRGYILERDKFEKIEIDKNKITFHIVSTTPDVHSTKLMQIEKGEETLIGEVSIIPGKTSTVIMKYSNE